MCTHAKPDICADQLSYDQPFAHSYCRTHRCTNAYTDDGAFVITH
jgi:hypothetical protein